MSAVTLRRLKRVGFFIQTNEGLKYYVLDYFHSNGAFKVSVQNDRLEVRNGFPAQTNLFGKDFHEAEVIQKTRFSQTKVSQLFPQAILKAAKLLGLDPLDLQQGVTLIERLQELHVYDHFARLLNADGFYLVFNYEMAQIHGGMKLWYISLHSKGTLNWPNIDVETTLKKLKTVSLENLERLVTYQAVLESITQYEPDPALAPDGPDIFEGLYQIESAEHALF